MTEETLLPKPEYEGWAIIEIMGHTKVAGEIKEVSMAGAVLLRVDVPSPDDSGVLLTQYYSGASIFSVTPCSKETAMQAIDRIHYSLPDPVRLALRDREKVDEDLNALPSPDALA